MSSFLRCAQAAFVGFLLFLQSAVVLAERRPWDEAAFRAAQAAGKPILVDVYAVW